MARKKNILLVHNHYAQSGGEDVVVETEKNILIKNGFSVSTYFRSNLEAKRSNIYRKSKILCKDMVWSSQTYHEVRKILKKEIPDNTDKKTDDNVPFEQAFVNQIANEFLVEQRRSRRWSVFFKILLALYLFSFLLIYLAQHVDGMSMSADRHTALIDIDGVISSNSEASADHIVSGLRAAFKDKNTAGIIIRINSPG